ncbi:hypothetical protein J2T60_002337 [Natronospira proteinivora]|uniref:FAD binding domain-containing protein n=1 Tax=Natronospira proteinivora TaxID=1807133 RepID=A0ABT1GBA3_9GAMM|nr:hypothetical protein [Natronospira proteinivora]MCP1728337.1 hypothetical protein [Natronospira proteinivora]
MLSTKLRRATDNEFIPVHLGGLALMVRGQIRVRPTSSESATSDSGAGAKQVGPGVTVNCASLQDAQQCMEFAARNGLLLSVFNGKSESGTPPACDGGMAVDLSAVRFNAQ